MFDDADDKLIYILRCWKEWKKNAVNENVCRANLENYSQQCYLSESMSKDCSCDKPPRRAASAGSRRCLSRSESRRCVSASKSRSNLILKEMCRREKVSTYEQRIPTKLSLDITEVILKFWWKNLYCILSLQYFFLLTNAVTIAFI